MTVTPNEYYGFMQSDLANGYVIGFGTAAVGILNLNGTVSQSGKAVRIFPEGAPLVASGVNAGLVNLPGGGVFNVWGLAGQRAPTTYPMYTQRIVYTGDVEITLRYSERLRGFIGMTGTLQFHHGTLKTGGYGAKSCPAILLSVGSEPLATLNTAFTTSKTTIVLAATWQQTGAFTE